MQTPRKLSANLSSNRLKNQSYSRKPLTQGTFRRNIAISAIAFLSLSSTLNANPNEINLQGGGAAQNELKNQVESAIESEVKNELDSTQNSSQDSLIDSLQNPQTTSQDSTQNPHKYDKKSKRYNKLIKNESKYDDLQAKQLDRVVVSASGYEQDIKNAPASISIIPKEEIMTRPIRDLGDAVQDTPGVYVEANKTGGNTISMRGFGSAYTLILIDGKRQNVAQGFDSSGFANGTYSSFMPPLSAIERIEVIRGPASTIYGSDAMGGGINVITKKNPDKLTSSIQLESRFSENPNQFGNTYGGNFYIASPLKKDLLSFNLRGNYRVGEQNSFLKPSNLQGDTSTNKFATWSPTGFTTWNFGGRLNYTPDKHNTLYFDSEVYFARTGSLNSSRNSVTAIRDYYKFNEVLSHTADYSWGKIDSYVQYSHTMWGPHENVPIGGSKGDRVLWGNNGNGKNNIDVIFQSAYNNNFDLGNAGVIIFNGGLYYLWEQLKFYNTTPANRSTMSAHQVALFGEGEYIINEYISTTLGLRLNYSDKFNSLAVPNPRFYVNVNPTQWLTFKGGVTSGVLIPQLSYLYEGFTLNNNSNALYGNKNLKPEQSWNYELSAIVDTNYAMFIATGYFTDFRSKIQGIGVNQGETNSGQTCDAQGATTCTFYRNLDRSIAAGAEVGFKLKPIYGFSLDANYAFTYTKVLSDSNTPYLKGEPISQVPLHKFTLTPRYAYKGFEVYLRYSGNFRTMTPTPNPSDTQGGQNTVRGAIGKYYKDYMLLDLGLSQKFADNKITATFAINNLLDVNFIDWALYASGNTANGAYTNRYQRILPSRSYWLTLRYDF
ncbi:TonB-dependent receptor domain-containing protein [Helicobacter sp. MIT 01-3238]|uniref:TonB-dependent receptor domain-containing protein n=1 Tax=Helicobacter sp. MIT 01-3238 TaxID=398627 RepID=UPI000E1F68BC|nr:TonB-dependent receptor [Helicobacter sp. MIT 01-3238]RDU52322.1 ferric enterobactin uptake receptor [Helicobacter sp. MIT 01-3238]